MKTWTPQAEQRLSEYLQERVTREQLDDSESAELKEDLRRHVYEEAEQQGARTIGWVELETILSRMDAGYRPAPVHTRNAAGWRGKLARIFIWAAGVVLPLIVLLVEVIGSLCGKILFDPIPTWWHVAMVAMVPMANIWLLIGAPKGNQIAIGAIAGFILVVSGFYALLFLPLLHLSLLALLAFGFGLLSLTPILTWLASWRIGRRLKLNSTSPKTFLRSRRGGIAAAVVSLILLEGPGLWTRANLSAADGTSKNDEVVARLRTFHSERTLLAACYQNPGFAGGSDMSGWMLESWKIPLMMVSDGNLFDRTSEEKYRDVFFRVTGKPFNSVKPPSYAFKSVRGSREIDEMEFDPNVGGDDVAVRLKTLDLKESRFDGHVDSISRIGYGEWTMVFRNVSTASKEARCQVKLPQDGRVSRLTLWVNGEPREAAFSTVSKVKAAYKEIAVVQQRDPVLVTMVGPDTVMVQCFPVPAHGEMKIRIGVTAALDGKRWDLPRIIERNFGIADEMEHAVWLQADSSFHLTGAPELHASMTDGPGSSMAVTLAPAQATGSGVALEMTNQPGIPQAVWCEDPFASAEQRILTRVPKRLTDLGSGKVVMVIDGSVALKDAKPWLTAALDQNVIAILADDHAVQVDAAKLNEYRFSGGRDNEPALRKAIQIAREKGGLPIVWIHGPQAVKLSQTEALLQLLERGTVVPVIYSVQAVAGPNRLAEAIYRSGSLRRGVTLENPAKDLVDFLTKLERGGERFDWEWRRSPTADEAEGTMVWDQLARLWAARAVEDPAMMLADDQKSSTAAHYQLVTPVSGAVVLETLEQFQQNDLTPVDASAAPHVPTVPEPSAVTLILITLSAGLLRRKR